MNKNTVFTILAIIGGIVVLGWALKLTFKLLVPVLVIGGGYLAYKAYQNKRIGGPR